MTFRALLRELKMKKKKKRSTRKEKQGDQTTIIHLFQSHAAAAGRTPHTPPMDRQTDGRTDVRTDGWLIAGEEYLCSTYEGRRPSRVTIVFCWLEFLRKTF